MVLILKGRQVVSKGEWREGFPSRSVKYHGQGYRAESGWLIPIIPATREAEIWKITVQGQACQK
jgi:hypothetical protein